MCNKTNMHHSMLINAVTHTYPNFYSHLSDVLFCLTGIFTYQTDGLPSSIDVLVLWNCPRHVLSSEGLGFADAVQELQSSWVPGLRVPKFQIKVHRSKKHPQEASNPNYLT